MTKLSPDKYKDELGEEGTKRKTLKAQPRVNVSANKIGMTFFMSPATHTRMKEMALSRKTSLQQLVAEAVDEWLANQGEPEFQYKAE